MEPKGLELLKGNTTGESEGTLSLSLNGFSDSKVREARCLTTDLTLKGEHSEK